MKILNRSMILIFISLMLLSYHAMALVEWDIQQTITLDKKPVDMAMSSSGSYLFVLTEDGIIYVYDSAFSLKGKINAGKNIDGIAVGPDENKLFLKSKKDREISTILVDIIHEITTEGSPFMGKADAPVVMTVFTDYQCPYCARLHPLLKQLVENNKDTLKIVFKNLPLQMHKFAKKAASAALAAHSSGKFMEMQDELYKNMNNIDINNVRKIASDLGLDLDEFERKMNSKEIQRLISMDIMDAEKLGVRGTPTIFINGKISKDRSINGIQNIIDKLLKEKQ